MAYVGTKVVADVRSQLFRHLHALTLNFHNNYSVGRMMSRLIGDVGVMQEFAAHWSGKEGVRLRLEDGPTSTLVEKLLFTRDTMSEPLT